MRVVGALGLAGVGQAVLRDRPARRAQRHRLRAAPEQDRLIDEVDVIDTQVSDFAARAPMQQSENAQQRFVRVDSRVGGPPPEQLTLLIEGDGRAHEPSGALGRKAAGRVDEDDLVGSCEAEELPDEGEAAGSAVWPHGQERLDVANVGQCPVVLAAVVMQVLGQVPDRRQGPADGDVTARQVPARRARSRDRSKNAAKDSAAGRTCWLRPVSVARWRVFPSRGPESLRARWA